MKGECQAHTHAHIMILHAHKHMHAYPHNLAAPPRSPVGGVEWGEAGQHTDVWPGSIPSMQRLKLPGSGTSEKPPWVSLAHTAQLQSIATPQLATIWSSPGLGSTIISRNETASSGQASQLTLHGCPSPAPGPLQWCTPPWLILTPHRRNGAHPSPPLQLLFRRGQAGHV